MKNYLYITIISLVLISCGGSEDSPTPPPPTNTAPTIPTQVVPTNNKLCISNLVTFQWNLATDAEKDPIVYQMQVAKDQQFSQIVETYEGTNTIKELTLQKGTAYYWRVKATDDENLSSEYSTIYNFYTSGDAVINYIPFAPELVRPAYNGILNTTTATLEWKASDVDTTDKLVFDVYFGTVNPPTSKVSENIETKTLDVPVLPAKEYYWKVVVKDNKGGESIGQVWKFKTN
jgi:hypothetical protein